MLAFVARFRTIRYTTGASASPIGWARYILSTILSENQYDTKFMISANTNAVIMPLRPPRSPPTATNRPVKSARNSVVFSMLLIVHRPRFADRVLPARSSRVSWKPSRHPRHRQRRGWPRRLVPARVTAFSLDTPRGGPYTATALERFDFIDTYQSIGAPDELGMQIRVSEIPDDGLRLLDPTAFAGLYLDPAWTLDAVDLLVERQGEKVAIAGRFEATAPLPCS